MLQLKKPTTATTTITTATKTRTTNPATMFCCRFVVALFGLFLIVGCWASTTNNEVGDSADFHLIQGVKVYQGDRECVLVGGLCVHKSDCNEPTSNKGLCPSNAHRGVECCYELPLRPAPCEQHLGECMDRCHKTLMRPGTDCPNGQICCVLV